MAYHYAGAILVICSLVALTRASGWWMDQPYDDSADFNEDVEYEQNATLYCNDSSTSPEGPYTFQEWIRPDLTVMKNGDYESFRTLYATAGWRVNNNELTVIYVQEQHFGFYYCRLTNATGDSIYIKKGVNYNGPFFGDLWEIYRLNVIIGCSAGGGFLLACLIIYVVHHFCIDDDVPMYEDPSIPEWHGASNGNQYSINNVTAGAQNEGYSVEQNQPTEKYMQLDTPL